MEFPFDLKNLNYFADDAEYETWKSDFADAFVKYLFEKEHINKAYLELAADTKKYRNMSLKQIKDETSWDKSGKEFALSKDMKYNKDKYDSLNDLAGYMFNKNYIHNEKARDALGNDLFNFILAMKYLNKKEAFSDIFSHIEERFEKIAKS